MFYVDFLRVWRIINDFFTHFLIFERFQLPSLEIKFVVQTKLIVKRCEDKAMIAEWLMPLPR